MATASPTCTWPAGAIRRPCIATTARAGGALRFEPVHDPAVDLTDVFGAYPLDIDGDGQVDLAVLRNRENVLLRGLGDCRFERANETWSFDGGEAMTTAFSATWEGSNALPTLALGNYRLLDAASEPGAGCDDNELIRPNPAGTGYGPPDTLAPGYCALSMLFSDWDRSGRRDLRVSNDRQYYDPANGQEQLWRIAPGRRSEAVHRRRWLGAAPDRGDGHRQPGPDRRMGYPRSISPARAPTGSRPSPAARPPQPTAKSRSSAA